MATSYPHITKALHERILEQHMYFVASAPLSAQGHVNVSPKGFDTFRILNENKVAYLDLTGSSNETSAHLLENGRITIMFCTFDGSPAIIRLYGTGRTVLPHHAEWAELAALYPEYSGTRQIIVVDVHEAVKSCGYGVPLMEFVGMRDTMERYNESLGPDGLEDYRHRKNATSVDGLPTPLGCHWEEQAELAN
jgi:hypothetical protein